MASEKSKMRNALRKADISDYMEGIETVTRALTLENLRNSTVKVYQSYLIIFSAWLVLYCNSLSFAEVTVDTVRDFLEFLKKDLALAPNTMNGYLAAVRKMFNIVRDEELSKRAVPDLAVDQHIPRVPSTKQVLAMLKACSSTMELLFIALLITTGIRLNELINLKFTDIQKDKSVIYISAEAKGRADGYVPLSNYVLKLLTLYCKEYNATHSGAPLRPDDYIFFKPDRSGHVSSYQMRSVFIQIQKRAGLEEKHIRPHAMRHYFALQVYMQTRDLFLVRNLLRHRTLAATLKYLVMASSMDAQRKYNNPGDAVLGNLNLDSDQADENSKDREENKS